MICEGWQKYDKNIQKYENMIIQKYELRVSFNYEYHGYFLHIKAHFAGNNRKSPG